MKDWIDRFIALLNEGRGHEMEQELIERARMEGLLEEFKTAEQNRDFKRIDSWRKKLRAETKRQSVKMNELEERVVKTRLLLKEENNRVPTIPEIRKRLGPGEYGRTIRRILNRFGLDYARGKPGRAPK
jgi:hypothetical protein